jgi:hypothetical protein
MRMPHMNPKPKGLSKSLGKPKAPSVPKIPKVSSAWTKHKSFSF